MKKKRKTLSLRERYELTVFLQNRVDAKVAIAEDLVKEFKELKGIEATTDQVNAQRRAMGMGRFYTNKSPITKEAKALEDKINYVRDLHYHDKAMILELDKRLVALDTRLRRIEDAANGADNEG